MPTANLGRVAYVHQGAYLAETIYQKYDVVLYENGSYVYWHDTPEAGHIPGGEGNLYWQPMLDPAALNEATDAAGAAAHLAQETAESISAVNEELAEKVETQSAKIDEMYEDIADYAFPIYGNLYDKSLAVDGYIVHNNPSRYPEIDPYAAGIYSGISPIAPGVYTISQQSRILTRFFFSDSQNKAVCACYVQVDGTVNSFGAWPVVDGRVKMEKISNNAWRITVKDPKITGVAWDMSGSGYWPDHTEDDFQSLIATAILAQGSEVPEYTEFGWGTLGIKRSAVEGLVALESDLQSVRQGKNMKLRKAGNVLTITTPWYDEELTLTLQEAHDAHGNFNFTRYSSDGGFSKTASDDICPVSYNGSYRGGGHGEDSTRALTAAAHGKTDADVGSVWQSANGTSYVIIRIQDADTLWVLSEYTGNDKNPFVASMPTSPLTHVSGAANTGSIAFTAAAQQLIEPHPVRLTHVIQCDGVPILYDDEFKAESIDLIERYEMVDLVKMLEILKANAGNNTSEDYHSDTMPGEMVYEVTYHFAGNGSCTVSTSLTALRDGIWVSYAGLVQAQQYAATLYVPFTRYDTPTVQPDGETIALLPETWRDAAFPPYKYYQLNEEKGYGFALGYDISAGQGMPENRMEHMLGGNYAGFYYGSSKKMYPAFCSDNQMIEMKAGDTISANAFRMPVKIEENAVQYWWDSGKNVMAEIEVFAAGTYAIALPDKCIGRHAETVKASEGLKAAAGGVISGNQLIVVATQAGSATVKVE